MAEHDPMNMSIDEQLEWLLEGTYFADEGGLAAGEDSGSDGLRAQMTRELKKKLEWSAKKETPLRIYLGVDPTRDSLHIGHMIPAKYLRRFQDLGHVVVFLMGDYTATIGDPSGQSKEREQLTHERVLEHAKFYADQAFRLLDPGKTEIRYNSEWLADLRFAEIAELAALFPLGQIIARQDFRTRLESGAGVRFHECLYSLMQGYDAFALNCDVQVGAYDQHFNLLAGRIIQQHFADKLKGQEHPLFARQPATRKNVHGPHVMLTIPLLMGTDGRKMSKSWGNTIDVLDSAEDMSGKVMRISDEMIGNYIDIAVEERQRVKDEWKAKAEADPMGVKKWIAGQVTAMYHGEDGAARAEEHFRRTVQEGNVEQDAVELQVPEEYAVEGEVPEEYRLKAHEPKEGVELPSYKMILIRDLLVLLNIAPSKKEASRLMTQGAVKLLPWQSGGQETIVFTEPQKDYYNHPRYKGSILKVGKRKIFKLV